MAKYFQIPFAMNGDRKEIPTDKQDDGSISFDEGYGLDYQKNKQTDPTAKDINRESFNSILHDITGAIGEIQRSGVATWTNEISYNKGATIIHNGAVYTSTINANKNEPPHTSWSSLDLSVYRKKDDLLFNGMMQVQATDDVGTGVFLLDKDGNPRGQMTHNSGGLQFAQHELDGVSRTYTLPDVGGELMVSTAEEIAIEVGAGFKTLDEAITIIRNCSNPTHTSYVILLKTDISDRGVVVSGLPKFNNPITIKGDGDMKIWSAPSNAYAYAFRDDKTDGNANAYKFENIEFNGWYNNTTNSGGIVTWFNKRTIVENCRFINCGIGVWVSRTSEGLILSSYFEGCQMGAMVQYHSNMNVGQANKKCTFERNVRGIMVGRNGTCHNDYSTFLDNDYNVWCAQNGRLAHAGDVTYGKWNNACILNQTGQIVENMSSVKIDLTAVTNTTPLIMSQYGALSTANSDGRDFQLNTFKESGGFDVMQDGVRTLSPASWISLNPAHVLLRSGNVIKFKLGTSGLSGSSYKLEFTSSSDNINAVLLSLDIPNGSASVELDISFNNEDANYKCHIYTGNNVTIRQGRITKATIDKFMTYLSSGRLVGRCYITSSGTVNVVTQYTEIAI